MAGAQVFTCNYSGSIKNKLLKGGEKLFLKIEDTKISGKGYICNEEGRNGYIDNFEYPISDVREVFKGEYQGNQALIMNTRITSLYGTKKAQTIFPSIKDIDTVIEILGSIKESSATMASEVRLSQSGRTSTHGAPVVPSAPGATPAAPAPTKPDVKVVKVNSTVGQNVVIKKESPLRSIRSTGQSLMPSNASASDSSAAVGSAVMRPRLSESAPTLTPVTVVVSDEEEQQIQTPASAVQEVVINAEPVAIQPEPVAEVVPETPVIASAIVTPAPAPKAEEKKDSEDFEKRMKKLYVLKDCGMLNDKEFEAKKLELVSELCGMTDFNEKVQKLVVLKECGMLSEKEFETRKIDIIKECCNTDVEDVEEYRRSVERLPYIKLGGMITETEFEEKKADVLKEVEYDADDELDVLRKKLVRWPILRDCEMLTNDEFNVKVQTLVDLIDVSFADSIEELIKKLNKWPILVEAGLISENELKKKQIFVIEEFVNAPWASVSEFKAVVERLMALKTCNWLSEMDFHTRKVELLRKVSAVEDYVTKVQLYIALPSIGLISEGDYLVKKQEFVDEIFAPYESMDEFQNNVKKLMDLEKTGMLSSDEFANYKMKLMSEL